MGEGIELAKNGNSPGYRRFRWSSDIGRLIEIVMDNYELRTWRVGVTAYEDRPEGRFWKTETLFMPGPMSEPGPGWKIYMKQSGEQCQTGNPMIFTGRNKLSVRYSVNNAKKKHARGLDKP